jgi:hypothetical protein
LTCDEGDLTIQVDDQTHRGARHVHQRHPRADIVLDRIHLEVLIDVDLGLDRHITARARAARQGLALVALDVQEGKAARVPVVDVAVEHITHAAGAGAVGVGVRQPDPGAQAGVEDRLVIAADDLATQRLDGHDERLGHHTSLLQQVWTKLGRTETCGTDPATNQGEVCRGASPRHTSPGVEITSGGSLRGEREHGLVNHAEIGERDVGRRGDLDATDRGGPAPRSVRS